MHLDLGVRQLDLARPVVMGILNVTTDSFFDGGRFVDQAAALEHARVMVAAGAAIIDIGGESTRPGADAVPVDEELARVIPLIEALAADSDAVLSIDTQKPEVMRAAVAAGATLINDVNALEAPGALAAAAESGVGVCLMHRLGTPQTMQRDPQYVDVVSEVHDYLEARVAACEVAGIARERLVVDPGFGFGKTLKHNLQLMGNLGALLDLRLPLLVGLSRKSMFGALLERPLDGRLAASVSGAALAVWQGAKIVRAHDVAATSDAISMAAAARRATASTITE